MTNSEALEAWLRAGTREHYLDAELYDHEYRRRREDLRYYRALACEAIAGAPEVGTLPLLELGCGTGRLLVPLVRDGHQVVGIDNQPAMLARCATRLERLPVVVRRRAELRRADFRAFDLHRRFRLILCPFNGLMHLYSRQDVERLLACVRGHLAPGGRFAFDVMNPDLKWLSRDPKRRWSRTRFRHPRSGQPMIYSLTQVYDGALQIAFMRIFYQPVGGRARPRLVRLTHRQFFPVELEALLHYNGFEIERRDGDFEGGEFRAESEQQVCVCRCRPRRRPTASRRGRSSRRENATLRRKIIDNAVGV